MTIKEFENKIKTEIDSGLSVKINPNHNEVAGVYYGDYYINVTIPSTGLKDEVDNKYGINIGERFIPHRNIQQSFDLVGAKLKQHKKLLEEDPELFND